MFKGNVASIHIATAIGEPTTAVAEVRAIPGKGLVGDRNYTEAGTKAGEQITLIEREALDALNEESGIQLAPGESRRNIETSGVPLNHLVGQEFTVGEVRLRGIRLCEPCQTLAGMTNARVLPGLVHRGGLRAEILSEGVIRPGDVIAAAGER